MESCTKGMAVGEVKIGRAHVSKLQHGAKLQCKMCKNSLPSPVLVIASSLNEGLSGALPLW